MNYMKVTTRQAMDMLRERLSEHRYGHSIGVMELCGQLAEQNGIDKVKAETAGLLHDCAKYMTDSELVDYCLGHGFQPDELQLASPHLLHGPAGAYMARDLYGVEDEDILNAITYHTYGRPAMSALEQLVFCADLCEPGRTYPQAEELRELLSRDLRTALPIIVERQIEYNEQKGVKLYPATFDMLEYYKNHDK